MMMKNAFVAVERVGESEIPLAEWWMVEGREQIVQRVQQAVVVWKYCQLQPRNWWDQESALCSQILLRTDS